MSQKASKFAFSRRALAFDLLLYAVPTDHPSLTLSTLIWVSILFIIKSNPIRVSKASPPPRAHCPFTLLELGSCIINGLVCWRWPDGRRDHVLSRLERVWGPGDGRPVEELKVAIDQVRPVDLSRVRLARSTLEGAFAGRRGRALSWASCCGLRFT